MGKRFNFNKSIINFPTTDLDLCWIKMLHLLCVSKTHQSLPTQQEKKSVIVGFSTVKRILDKISLFFQTCESVFFGRHIAGRGCNYWKIMKESGCDLPGRCVEMRSRIVTLLTVFSKITSQKVFILLILICWYSSCNMWN